MKFVLFVVAAFATIQAINCYVDSDDSEELMHQISMKMLRERIRERAALEQARSKIEEICPGYGSQLENVTLEIQSCVALVDEDEETVCSMVQNHLKRCLMPLTNMFEECLPKQSKQVPAMLVDMSIAVFKRICKTDGEHILELGNTCIRNTNSKTTRCARRLATKVQQYSRNQKYPSPQDLCELFEGLRPCLQSHLNTACGHPITRESYLSMFDEALSVCKRSEFNEIEVFEPQMQ